MLLQNSHKLYEAKQMGEAADYELMVTALEAERIEESKRAAAEQERRFLESEKEYRGWSNTAISWQTECPFLIGD